MESLNKLLEKSIKENWERPALSNYQGNTLCYKDVALNIFRIHKAFAKCGLKKGDKVALCSKNQANWGVSFLSALSYGAVPVPLLHEFKPDNIHYLVNHSEAKVFFVDEAILENLTESEMPGVAVLVRMGDFKIVHSNVDLPDGIDGESAEGFSKEALSFYEDQPDELAIINYTSGTSGFSKGVMLPYRSLLVNAKFAHELAEPQMDNNSKMVAMLPSAHMYGMMFEFLFEMTIGAHVQFLTRLPSPKVIMNAFADVHPDVIISVPLILEKVYRSKLKPLAEKNKTFLKIPILNEVVKKKFRDGLIESFGSKFEEVILGGAAVNPEVEDFLRMIKFPFTVGYGMTECGPIITYIHWDKTRRGSCGVPVAGCQIKIDSTDPEQIPGEVLVKGPNVFLGYYNNEKATKEAFTEDGWFRTGDMGVVDKDGYLYLKGRSKCMILGPSGQNIYPEELEAVINTVNYVVDSLVVEDNGGLTALIFPDYQQGQEAGLSAEDLQAVINGRLPEINKVLPNYAQIRKIEFMHEDFERTPKKSIKRYLYQR